MAHQVTGECHETPLERAVERATVAGLEPAGYGRMRDGSRFWLVFSTTEPGRLHVVRMRRTQLLCDCTAGGHGRVCVHVGAVVMQLGAEAVQADRLAQRVAGRVAGDCGVNVAPSELDRLTAQVETRAAIGRLREMAQITGMGTPGTKEQPLPMPSSAPVSLFR
jgi:hypothetical protein